ncbi:hypothetical protein Clacol_006371 [Clathrus columnatus]|uniref:Protein transport protein sec16 n=1 Tax=Clathrus columnatus TaxID=1419009 RepID=A0AAV5AJK1_9AGAM|nr:hypothetical protein Clacol_006371 [Clathrus columnatus]
MSNQEGRTSVESAASLFVGTDTDTSFDSLFQSAEPENDAGIEPSHEPSYAEAANLFEAGPDENTDLFSQVSSLNISPSVDPVEPFVSEQGMSTAAYDGDSFSYTGYYPDTQSQAIPAEHGDQLETYESKSYQPTDVYSTNYYQPTQTSQWTTYATPNNTEYNNTVSPSSQYSYQQQTYYNASTSNSQDVTPSYTTPVASSPQYSAKNSFTSSDVYSSTEIPSSINTAPDVTAYRPTTMNAYDPPIPTKSRGKSRYALPKAPYDLASFQTPPAQRTASFPPPPPPSQFSSILPTPEQSQNLHGLSSALNISYSDGHNVHQVSQPGQIPWTTSTKNNEAEVMETNGINFGGSDNYYNPTHGATLEIPQKQDESEPLTSVDQELGSYSESHFTSTNPGSRAVEQGSFSTDAYIPGFSSEPDFYSPGQSNIPYESATHINSQVTAASLSSADEKPGSNISIPLAQNNYDPYAPTVRQEHDAHLFSSQHPHGSYEPYDRPLPQNDEKKTDVNTATAYPTIVDSTSKVTFLPISTAVAYAPYAPSPTLIGANDPLGRTSIRVPVISFGFGGKLVSCFHLAQDAGGFDISLTTHQTTSVVVRSLTEVIPASAMDSNGTSFPGPLFSDNSTSSLARTVGVGISSQLKNKKTTVIKWLDERAEELVNGMAYISSGSPERYKAEGKVVLLKLLKIMVENDGQLSGSPSLEWSVRTALVPRLQNEKGPTGDSSPDHSLYTPYLPISESTEQPIAVHYVKASALNRIKEFLIRGDKVKAYHFAMDEKLWAHAMLIANSVDAQSYKEVVKEFIRSELGIIQVLGSNLEHITRPNGNESLRVAYSLFSGQGAASLQELIPTKSLIASNGAQLTPITLNSQKPFSSSLPPGVPGESLAQWQETASMMVFSQASGDSAALTSLGDYLATNHWFEAAHACYLLSPRTSSFGGINVPSVRMVIVGSENPLTLPNFNKDLDFTLLSEVVEFALSLSSPKGQEPFSGLPHLQAYKLLRAYHLAEIGSVEAANRYCEAIGSTIRASPRGSQFYTPTFIGELKNLSDRLTAVPQSDKSGSWISRTMTKPSFDTIGSWLEGRFSKIIVGEGEDSVPSPSKESQAKATYGPFTHYSTISSAAPSAPTSRSSTPYAAMNTVATGPSILSQNPIDRAASAIDYARLDRQRASPIQRVASASAVASSGKSHGGISLSQHRASLSVTSVPEDTTTDVLVQESSWWGSNTTHSSDPTPTAAAFYKVETPETQGNGNFISLMDDVPSGFTSDYSKSGMVTHTVTSFDEEEEDLGFGNSSIRSKARQNISQEQHQETKESHKQDVKAETSEAKKPTAKPELKQQSSSWFSGIWSWGRGSSQSPGPIVANLGEEKSFYYDAELKRWVNKNAPDTSASATPPPPPPRARTASPSVTMPVSPSEQSPTSYTPPPRASSAAEPPRKPPRVRSNLVPKEDITVPSSAPPIPNNFDPPGLGNGMPPTSRPKSSSSKRNVRSRYVDDYALLPIIPPPGEDSPSILSLPDNPDSMSYGVATQDYIAPDASDNTSATSPLLRTGDRERIEEHRTDGGHASIMSCVGNLCNTIMGTGMLTFPLSVASAGLLPGVLTCFLSACIGGFGLYLLSVCATRVASHRKASFFAVSQLTFPKAAIFFDLAIAIKCFGVSISYLIIIKGLMPNVVRSLYHDLFSGEPPSWALDGRIWVTLSMIVLVPLCFLHQLNSLRHASYIAVFAAVYLVLIVVICYFYPLKDMPMPGPVYWVHFTPNFISTFPVQVFAYTCAQNIFPIYNEVIENTQIRMNTIISTSIGFAAIAYEIIAVFGYLTFGTNVGSNIIAMYPSTSLFIALGQFAIVVTVLLGYPLQVHPCRNCLDKVFRSHAPPKPISNEEENEEEEESYDAHAPGDLSIFKHTLLTACIVGTGFLIALVVNDLQLGNVLSTKEREKPVLAFVGSTGSTTISFILPLAIMFTKLRVHKYTTFSYIIFARERVPEMILTPGTDSTELEIYESTLETHTSTQVLVLHKDFSPTMSYEDYWSGRRELITKDQSLLRDYTRYQNLQSSAEIPRLFPEMEFLTVKVWRRSFTARSVIESAKLFEIEILRKMPKAALLHIHMEASVDAAKLLKLALSRPVMHVRFTGPIHKNHSDLLPLEIKPVFNIECDHGVIIPDSANTSSKYSY